MTGCSRRFLLKSAVALSVTASLGTLSPAWAGSSKPRVVVVGAGAFGGWTALHLLRAGADVTLVDAWGPGNSRASSGGETRIIRRIYGPDRHFTELADRALSLWLENQRRWNLELYRQTGSLWLVVDSEKYQEAALAIMDDLGHPYERLSAEEAARRYPQVAFDGVEWAVLEPESGYLLARRGCEAVLQAFLAEGGAYRQARAEPGPVGNDVMQYVALSDGRLEADHYVFACGPWLGRLFPDIREDLVVPTRQEVYYFGTPAGSDAFDETRFPTWINHDTKGIYYGVPGNRWRGFKIANDARGPRFDPTSGDRMPSREGVEQARAFLARRFPAMKDAPLLEARVCQYENSPDSSFIIDNHPAAENCWLVGGGSGHGYKMGPAVGEMAAALILEGREQPSQFRLARFRDID